MNVGGTTAHLGATQVRRVVEQEGPRSRPEALFPAFDRAVFDCHLDWLAPNFFDVARDQLVSSFHSWVIRTRHHTILVDTCAGNDRERPNNPGFHQLRTPYLSRLGAAGVDPDSVDYVLCTHLHADHCGWNTQRRDGRWMPTFPRAKYLFSAAELQAVEARSRAAGDVNAGVYEDSVLPVIEAGLVTTVSGLHAIEDGVVIEPAPGHTPGSVVLRVGDAGPQGLFTGDVMHHPIQVVRPDWNSRWCEDPEAARATRQRILQESADRDVTLFPGHFGRPYAGRVRSGPDGFRMVP